MQVHEQSDQIQKTLLSLTSGLIWTSISNSIIKQTRQSFEDTMAKAQSAKTQIKYSSIKLAENNWGF